jgi:hypothetical protein
MTLIHPEVLARWAAFSEPLEGRVPWLYLDVKGLPTTAVGCLVPDLATMLSLPWMCRDADKGPASADRITREWYRVKSMRAGLLANQYRGCLYLSDDAIDDLMRRRLEQDARSLAVTFPAFPDWNPSAQQGSLSMAWAMGAGFPAKYPKWSAAARDQDWATCARECGIQSADNPGVVARNDANRRLFEEAAGT